MMENSEYSKLIIEGQHRLFGFVFSLLGDNAASWDVLQETNIILWQKQEQFELGTNFDAWARRIARFQTMAYLRDRKRMPLDLMTPEVMESFGHELENELEPEKMDEKLSILSKCREKLKERSRKMLELYYEQNLSVQQVGEALSMNPNATKQALLRIRRSLHDCIETGGVASSS